jgi:hypothetical protein
MDYRLFTLWMWLTAGAASLVAETSGQPPGALDYREVRAVLLSNLVGTSEAELDAAAARGLIEQLAGRVTWVTNAPDPEPSTAGPIVAKAITFDGTRGYIRLARLDADADTAFSLALKELTTTNALDGLVLDLRFTTGSDYAAAARLAGQFIPDATLVLRLGAEEFASTTKDDALTHPTMVLVNSRTTGAPEALAAALRQHEAALILGGRTAGAAGVFRELTLSSGQRLRVVAATVKVGEDAEVPPGGVIPDIVVNASLAEERRYLDNPYGPTGGLSGATNVAGATNRPARITEADLVRMRRSRQDPSTATPGDSRAVAPVPTVMDPALARALDLLKGISVVTKPRRN